ncbi:hypothetical protein EAE96_007065 [Botrytis aclada]|nr:hypothetical protein EAE96_007065 [Botrytis aclada]
MQASGPKNKFDHTEKVLEIIRGQGVADESVEPKIREIFKTIEADVKDEGLKQLEEYEKERMELEEADAIADTKAKAESAEDKERREERAERILFRGEALEAVVILRAIHQTTAPLRHNKWRKPNAGFTNKNIRIRSKIGQGGFGAVYLIENVETGIQYAMKTQTIRLNDDEPMMTPPAWRGAETPLTPSSEASKRSAKAMKERHLRTKRFNETKCYLQYIRSSHPSICNLEAFFDLQLPDDEGHCHIFEYCQWGNLENIVTQYYDTPRWGTGEPEGTLWSHKPKDMPTLYKHAAIPEAFIWHVYMQTMEALSFLHGDHELNKKQEFHARNQVICLDIKLDNMFLRDSGKPNTYPTVKLGDFGEATYVPYGETRWHDTGTAVCKPPEEPYLNAKYDVWCLGISLYIMTHSGRRPKRPLENGKQNMKDEPKWALCDPHLSKVLAKELEKPREMDVEKRWTAARILDHIRPIAEETIRLTYRTLQNWARPQLMEFEEGYLERLEGGEEFSEMSESDYNSDDDDDDDDDDGEEEVEQPPRPPGTSDSGEKKTKEQLAIEQLARDQQAQQARLEQVRDDLAKEEQAAKQLAKDQLVAENLARERLATGQLSKNQRAKEKETRDQQARDQQAKVQQLRDQLAIAEQAKERLKEKLKIQQEEESKRQEQEKLRKEKDEESRRQEAEKLRKQQEEELKRQEQEELRKQDEEKLRKEKDEKLTKQKEEERLRRLQEDESRRLQEQERLRRLQEEGQAEESQSLAPPRKRRLIRYRKHRAYRV